VGTPFLDYTTGEPSFSTLWDGPNLSSAQVAIVNLALGVASNWIYDRLPGISPTDSTAQLVVFGVVSNLVRYGKYAPLSSFHRATGHKIDSGTLAADVQRSFTDDHKLLLGIPLRAAPVGFFRVDDYDDPSRSGEPTGWWQ
jgi:hypothetical protein